MEQAESNVETRTKGGGSVGTVIDVKYDSLFMNAPCFIYIESVLHLCICFT